MQHNFFWIILISIERNFKIVTFCEMNGKKNFITFLSSYLFFIKDEKAIYLSICNFPDAPTETCCIKRKSTSGDVTDDAKEVASPKKAKLDEKPAPVEVETNGS